MQVVQSERAVAQEAKSSVESLQNSIAKKKELVAEANSAEAAALQSSIDKLQASVAAKQREFEAAQTKIAQQELKLGMQQALILKEKDQIVQSFTSSVRKMENMVQQQRKRHRANLLRKLQLRRQKHKKSMVKGRPTTAPVRSEPGDGPVKDTAAAAKKPSVWSALAQDAMGKADS